MYPLSLRRPNTVGNSLQIRQKQSAVTQRHPFQRQTFNGLKLLYFRALVFVIIRCFVDWIFSYNRWVAASVVMHIDYYNKRWTSKRHVNIYRPQGSRGIEHRHLGNVPDPFHAVIKWRPDGSGLRQTTVNRDNISCLWYYGCYSH